MVATNVDIQSVFQSMLVLVPEFYNSLVPNQVDPNERIRWLSTFEEQIEEDLPRPYALLVNQPFGAQRNTEGDNDTPLTDSGVILYLEREAIDFPQSYTVNSVTYTGDQAMFVGFCEWFGAIQNAIEEWTLNTNMRFIRFRDSQVIFEPERTDLAKRDAHDDFFSVGIQFNIGQGGSV